MKRRRAAEQAAREAQRRERMAAEGAIRAQREGCSQIRHKLISWTIVMLWMGVAVFARMSPWWLRVICGVSCVACAIQVSIIVRRFIKKDWFLKNP